MRAGGRPAVDDILKMHRVLVLVAWSRKVGNLVGLLIETVAGIPWQEVLRRLYIRRNLYMLIRGGGTRSVRTWYN